ncbi:unnamed protein product [Vicia faba]|uniref:Pectinesterase n=1 Tax=Vicia faba TaxID=3906 RepID=A0AAV0ZYR1_VICFA|nr:unnamed protein product [Vicia faba]
MLGDKLSIEKGQLWTTPSADIVVAQDGSGNYKKISEGVAAVKGSGKGRVVIHVKAGVYKENIDIENTVKNIIIFGDGMDSTIVTGNHNAQNGSTTFRSTTFAWFMVTSIEISWNEEESMVDSVLVVPM